MTSGLLLVLLFIGALLAAYFLLLIWIFVRLARSFRER